MAVNCLTLAVKRAGFAASFCQCCLAVHITVSPPFLHCFSHPPQTIVIHRFFSQHQKYRSKQTELHKTSVIVDSKPNILIVIMHHHHHHHHGHHNDHHHAAVDLKYSCGDLVRVGVNAPQSSGLYFLHRHTTCISNFVFTFLLFTQTHCFYFVMLICILSSGLQSSGIYFLYRHTACISYLIFYILYLVLTSKIDTLLVFCI